MNIDSLAIITSTIVTLTTIIIKYQSDKFYKQHDSLLKSIDSRIALLDDQIKELTKESKKYVETCGKYLSMVDQYTLNSVELADFEAAAFCMMAAANDSYVNDDIEFMVRGMRAKHKRQEFLDYGAQDYLYSYFKNSIDSINDKITKLSKEQSLLLEQQRNLYPSTLGNTLKQWLSEKLSRQQNNKK